jgi:hypothetical protein
MGAPWYSHEYVLSTALPDAAGVIIIGAIVAARAVEEAGMVGADSVALATARRLTCNGPTASARSAGKTSLLRFHVRVAPFDPPAFQGEGWGDARTPFWDGGLTVRRMAIDAERQRLMDKRSGARSQVRTHASHASSEANCHRRRRIAGRGCATVDDNCQCSS